MQINITEFKAEDKEELVNFLSGERWDFHSTPLISKEKLNEQLQNGYFTDDGKITFWISEGDRKIGMIRLFDLGDDMLDAETPLFDIKITKDIEIKMLVSKL